MSDNRKVKKRNYRTFIQASYCNCNDCKYGVVRPNRDYVRVIDYFVVEDETVWH